MKKRLTIIIIAFCISFASVVTLSLFSMERFAKFSDYSNQVDHSSLVIMSIRGAEVSLRDLGLTERGYMITRDTMYLRFLNNSVDSLNKAVAEITRLVSDDKRHQKNLTLLKGNVALRIAAVRENLAYIDTSGDATGQKYFEDARQLMIQCVLGLRDMRLAEYKLLQDRFTDEKIYEKLTNSTLTLLLIIFCVMTFLLFLVMIKELRGRMIFQEQLEAKVIDLKRSHSELQEIAYAASHDLQEPLRKIRVFSDMLQYHKPASEEECRNTLARINSSARRMQMLIADLMSLTSLTNTSEKKVVVDLNGIVQSILVENHDRILEKGAIAEVIELPIIDGYETQLTILFKALLDNALKFTREGVTPIITISSEIMNGHELSEINPKLINKKFYRITFSDNGIGFDNKFINKIFRIFQRLHTHESEYDGKGIGLAICQRIMANHEGYMIAHGEPGMGAKFKLFFPATD